jgi:hypothetical protein
MRIFTTLIITTLFYCSSCYAFGFESSRANKWSILLMPTVTDEKVVDFQNGAKADISRHSGLAFGFGYNYNSHLEIGLLFHTAGGNYTGTRVDENGTKEKFTANLYTSRFDIDLTYNISRKAFTPYVSLFLGSTYIDSGVPTGNITTGCWYDPWYGYICTPVAETYTSNQFDYGIGAGLRYDFNRQIFIKGGISQTFIDIDKASTPDFIRYQVGVGFMF